MRKYAHVLSEKAAKQRALANAGELTLGADPSSTADDISESEDEGLPNERLLPELQRKSAAKKNSGTPDEKVPGADGKAVSDEGESGSEVRCRDWEQPSVLVRIC